MHTVDIVVADDHPIVLAGLVTLLKEDKTFRVVASCSDGAKAIHAIQTLKPDIALLDMNMPGLNGLQVLNAIIAENLPSRVIFLAAAPSDDEIVAATAGGAYGIILKEMAPDTLLGCLHTVASGQKCLPGDLVDGAIKRSRDNREEIANIEQLLTRREITVMLKVADGLSNKDIGSQLNISEGTVKIHLNNIYHKLGVTNRTSLSIFTNSYRSRLSANHWSQD